MKQTLLIALVLLASCGKPQGTESIDISGVWELNGITWTFTGSSFTQEYCTTTCSLADFGTYTKTATELVLDGDFQDATLSYELRGNELRIDKLTYTKR